MPGEAAAPDTGSGKTGSPTAQSAGSAVTVTVNAVDANWNLVNTITHTIPTTSSIANGRLPAVHTCTPPINTYSVTFKTAASQTVTASDTSASPLTSNTGSATT